MDVVEKLSFNPEGYCKLPSTAGEKLFAKQNFFNKRKEIETELSYVDSMFEMWKLRWLIITSKDELISNKTLKQYKHLDGNYIFNRSCAWKCSAREKNFKPVYEERNRKALETGSLQSLVQM